METKKYWLRFTLLSLLPILLGLIVGLIVVKVGHQNCVDKSDLQKCTSELGASKEELTVFGTDLLLAETLQQSQLAAKRELDKLKIILNGPIDHLTAATVDSIVQAAMLKVGANISLVESDSPIFTVRQILIDYYKDQAIALGGQAKDLLRKKESDQDVNEYIESLKVYLNIAEGKVADSERNLQAKEDEIKRLKEEVGGIGCPPCPNHICDHSNCELGIDAAVLSDKIIQIEIFLSDLNTIYSKTNWAGDGKLRKWLDGRSTEYKELLIALQARYEAKVGS